MPSLRREYVILQDRREQKPLLFPDHLPLWDPASDPCKPRVVTVRLRTRVVELPTADYLLEAHPTSTVVERKGHLDELANNLCTVDGRRKFVAELTRLRSGFEHAILLLEGDPLSLQRTRDETNHSVVRDALLHLLFEYHVGLHLLPTSTTAHRRAAGEWLAATLIAGATHAHPPADDLHPPR